MLTTMCGVIHAWRRSPNAQRRIAQLERGRMRRATGGNFSVGVPNPGELRIGMQRRADAMRKKVMRDADASAPHQSLRRGAHLVGEVLNFFITHPHVPCGIHPRRALHPVHESVPKLFEIVPFGCHTTNKILVMDDGPVAKDFRAIFAPVFSQGAPEPMPFGVTKVRPQSNRYMKK